MTMQPPNRSFYLPDKSIEERKKLELHKRLSFDFFYYTKTALHRLGLTAGCVIATRHHGSIGSVEFLGGNGLHAGVQPRAPLSDKEKLILKQRLNRVTRGLDYDFGCIVVDVNGDFIGPAYFTESVTSWEENGSRNFGQH